MKSKFVRICLQEITLGQFLQQAGKNGLLENLTDRERSILTQHWLEGKSLGEIAPSIEVTTRERVRQIEARAWGKILSQIPQNQRQFISELLKNNRQSPEYRQRMSQIKQRNWQSPEYRQRMVEAQRRRAREKT